MLYIWAFFSDRFKEYYLPDQTNWNGALSFTQSETGWNGDLTVPIRALDGKWFVKCPIACSFTLDKKPVCAKEMEISKGMEFSVTHADQKIGFLVSEYKKADTEFTKYLIPKGRPVLIGRSEQCDICLKDEQHAHVSKNHAEIRLTDGGGCTVIDSSTNGSYLNGKRFNKTQVRFSFGDVIYLMLGLKIVNLGEFLAINRPEMLSDVKLAPVLEFSPRSRAQDATPVSKREIRRYPRRMLNVDDSAIEVESPINKTVSSQQPFILMVGPSLTMALPIAAGVMMTMFTSNGNTQFLGAGIVTVVISSVLAVVWTLANYRYRHRSESKNEELRIEKYRNYIREVETKIQARISAEKEAVAHLMPSLPECVAFICAGRERVWERTPNHRDFLLLSLARGCMPFSTEIKISEQRLSIIDDPLRDEPARLMKQYAYIPEMPVSVSLLEYRIIGIVGMRSACDVARSMMVQISALHSYNDVRIACVYPGSEKDAWEWVRWLPHIWATDDRKIRLMASEPRDIHDVMQLMDEVISRRIENINEKLEDAERPIPHYVVFAAAYDLVEYEPVMRYLLKGAPGFTLVVLGQNMGLLPKECSLIVDTGQNRGLYTMSGGEIGNQVNFESVDGGQLGKYSKSIAPLCVKEASHNLEIPALVTFLETYGVDRAEELDVWRMWNENHAYRGIRSVIGFKAGRQPFVLDISELYHGPHGLVAGTTGSGKSVMLQSYILSLALNYHPSEVQFILIDYKGGGMANAFKDLPHIAGTITNLGGNMTMRALASIKSEIKRRQRVFSRVGVDHIDKYMQLYRDDSSAEQMGHLIIIADEFAELKTDQPDFMSELISAARVGRSLGVHLILATQKPSGVVSEEIWSNTRFRICLRVQDKQNSMEMLKRPEAAYITGMGRCYVQVGNDEIFEQVQTCWSGAAYRPGEVRQEAPVALLDECGRAVAVKGAAVRREAKLSTQMEVVVDLIRETARLHSVQSAASLWQEPLPETLYLNDIAGFAKNAFDGGDWPKRDAIELMPIFGIADDPANQTRREISYDLIKNGNLLIAGMPASGKSTMLQTLAYSLASLYTPEQVNIYYLELGSRIAGPLKTLPQVGDVLYDDNAEDIVRFLRMLDKELASRKRLFSVESSGNFAEYVRLRSQRGQSRIPALVVAIDRFSRAKDIFSELQMSQLYGLIREGASYGIYFIVTANAKSEVGFRQQDSFTGIALRLQTGSDYSDVLGRALGNVSVENIHGRGLLYDGACLEYQAALPGDSPSDADRAQFIRQTGQAMRDAWKGAPAGSVPRIPERPSVAEMFADPAAQLALQDPWRLPVAYDVLEGTVLSVDLSECFSWLVYGPSGSGKTNALSVFMQGFLAKGAEIHMIAANDEIVSAARKCGAHVYAYDDPELAGAVLRIRDAAAERAKIRKEALQKGKEEALSKIGALKPICLLIDDLDVLREKTNADIARFAGQCFGGAGLTGIYSIAAVGQSGLNRIRSAEWASALLSQQRGIGLGGRMLDCDPFSLSAVIGVRNAPLPAGRGFLSAKNEVFQIVMPKA